MYARLLCQTGQLAGTSHRFTKETTIGKSRSNKLRLSPDTISSKHARIFFNEDRNCYYLEDLKSRNGTSLDGERVRGKERLGRLHIITLARQHDFIFQVVDDELKDERPGSDTVLESESAPVATPEIMDSAEEEAKHDITQKGDLPLGTPKLPEDKD